MKNIDLVFREIYINKITPFIDKPLIKVITGQRRVGKSYILLQIIEKIANSNSNIIFIDKEKFEFDKIKDYTDLVEYILLKKRDDIKNYIFIDEIQDITDFEKALRHFYSDVNFDIYCTGSNANLLSGELATALSGRYIEFKIYSLSYLEFLKFNNLENKQISLNKYIKYGGLPFLRNLPDNENIIFEYLKNIYSTIIYKDIIQRFAVRNTYFFENLVKYIAQNVGNIISANKISEYLKSQKQKISPQIVLTYLSHLQDAFMLFMVKRFDIIGKRVFELNEKYYFEDWGIKNAIVGFHQNNINQIIENIVFLHLKINNYDVKVGKINEFEIDFVAERNGEITYIQVAYLISDDNVKQREFGNLLKINDNWKKIVVSLDEFTQNKYLGIEHLKLIDFLSEFN